MIGGTTEEDGHGAGPGQGAGTEHLWTKRREIYLFGLPVRHGLGELVSQGSGQAVGARPRPRVPDEGQDAGHAQTG